MLRQCLADDVATFFIGIRAGSSIVLEAEESVFPLIACLRTLNQRSTTMWTERKYGAWLLMRRMEHAAEVHEVSRSTLGSLGVKNRSVRSSTTTEFTGLF